MKRLWFLCVLLMMAGVAGAQKVYFIYIQSDTNTPFFVKIGDQLTSAAPSGYVILPKLVDSVYQLTIGKTGQAASESRFSVTINKQDKGFLLREADGKFSLFDLQVMTSLQPIASASTSNETIAKRTDAFSVLLSQAANDPSLLDARTAVAATQSKPEPKAEPAVTIITKEPEKEVAPQTQPDTTTTVKSDDVASVTQPEKEPEKETIVNDTAQQTNTVTQELTAQENPVHQDTAAEATPYKPSTVTRRSESSTSEGFGLVFLDQKEDGTDTIRILIPNQRLDYKSEEAVHEDSKKFLNISNTDTAKADTSVAAANDKLQAAAAKKRKGCTQAASEREFFRLRKNMAARESEDAMVEEATKTFRRTCFSTEQIKYLSTLFLTPSGKYKFFDAAYGHVSNQEQYSLLQNELHDAYYVNRFKALIANQ